MSLKIKITLETRRLLHLSRKNITKIWCDECECETDFAPEAKIGEILERLEAVENPHRQMTAEGDVLICLDSLSNTETARHS